MELGKARLSLLVVLTAAIGFVLASGASIDWLLMGWSMLGTAMVALSANMLNQVIEAQRDAKMKRTASRPLPSGRLGAAHATCMALFLAGMGTSILLAQANGLTALLALAALLLYVGVYTPLKVHSTLNTVVGAVVGAIPPLMGWAAAAGQLDPGAWILAAILLTWQIPHFLALAWMYREDYRRGGFVMLCAVDETGRITSKTAVLWTMALVPITCATSFAVNPSRCIITNTWRCGALRDSSARESRSRSTGVLGLWFLKLALAMHRKCDDRSARKLFLASVLYLPLLMGLMLLDRTTGSESNLKSSPTLAARQ